MHKHMYRQTKNPHIHINIHTCTQRPMNISNKLKNEIRQERRSKLDEFLHKSFSSFKVKPPKCNENNFIYKVQQT